MIKQGLWLLALIVVTGVVFGVSQPKMRGYFFSERCGDDWRDLIMGMGEQFEWASYNRLRELCGGFGAWTADYEQLEISALFESAPRDYQDKPVTFLTRFESPTVVSTSFLVADEALAMVHPVLNGRAKEVIKQGAGYWYYRDGEGEENLFLVTDGETFKNNQGLFHINDAQGMKRHVKDMWWVEWARVKAGGETSNGNEGGKDEDVW